MDNFWITLSKAMLKARERARHLVLVHCSHWRTSTDSSALLHSFRISPPLHVLVVYTSVGSAFLTLSPIKMVSLYCRKPAWNRWRAELDWLFAPTSFPLFHGLSHTKYLISSGLPVPKAALTTSSANSALRRHFALKRRISKISVKDSDSYITYICTCVSSRLSMWQL